MVDEIAWGVGWGTEGDEAAPSDEESEPPYSASASRSQSRSHSQAPPDVAIMSAVDWQGEGCRSRPAMDAASRRSLSRVQRSHSRAPIYSDRTASSRSISRHSRRPSPSSATRANFSTHDTIPTPSSESGSYSSFFDESALILSPLSSVSSRSRGRRQKKLRHPKSRSPSPSVVPTTPVDGPSNYLEQPDDLHLDAEFSRGRSSLRPLVSDSAHGGGKHRVLTYGREMNDWVAHSIPEIEMEPVPSPDDDMLGHTVDSKNRVSIRSSETLSLALSSTETSTCWRQRPNSSPPTAARLHSRTDTAPPPTHLDAFLNSNASSSTAALIARSRSADAH